MLYFLIIDHIGKGGAEKLLISYAYYLQNNGYDVVILSQFSKNNIEGIQCKYGIKYLPQHLIIKVLIRIFIYLKFTYYCFVYKPQAIYSFLDSSNIITFFLPYRTQKIYSIHNKISVQYKKFNNYIYKLIIFIFNKIYNATKNRSIIAVSSFVNDDLIANFKICCDKIVVINNRINIKSINQLKKQNCEFVLNPSFNLLSIGRLSIQKAQWKIIKACKLLVEEKIPFRLYIMGDGEIKPLLMKQINDLKLNSHITILPYSSNPFTLFQQCDLLVLPSLYEGSPIVVTEAINLGVPFIGSQDALSSDIFKQNYLSYVYKNKIYSYTDNIEEDDIELFKLIKKCIANKDFRLEILDNCSDWTKEDESIMFAQYNNLVKT
jgi:glycosyltransferase involved in cell wall biosynthesis